MNYDTNMLIEIFAGDEHLASFTVNGLDEIASSELQKKENVTKPRVTLSFELSRSGILQLNKAEAKVEETYWAVQQPKAKKNATNASGEGNSTEEEPAKPDKVQKKRTIPYPLNRIDRVFHGPPTLTRD